MHLGSQKPCSPWLPSMQSNKTWTIPHDDAEPLEALVRVNLDQSGSIACSAIKQLCQSRNLMQAAQAPVPSQQTQLHGRRSPSPPGKPMFKSLSWQQPRPAPPSLKKQRSTVDTFKIPAGRAPDSETARRQTLRDVRDALAADNTLPVLPEVYNGYNCDVQVCCCMHCLQDV